MLFQLTPTQNNCQHPGPATSSLVSRRAAAVTTVVALVVGICAGTQLPSVRGQQGTVHHAGELNGRTDGLNDERSEARTDGPTYELIGTLAELEPRMARLEKDLGELRNFQALLSTPTKANTVKAQKSESLGLGGPEVPPNSCFEDMKTQRAIGEQPSEREHIDCLLDTLTSLEEEAQSHTHAWASFPGRAPVEGACVGSSYGNRLDPFNRKLSFHSGVDIAAASGTPILASAAGRVSFAGVKAGYGKVIEIDHGNGLTTRYGHASRLIAKQGDSVQPRQHIANVGSTGRSTGPHLHFEVLKQNKPTDPAKYMPLFAA